MSTFPQSLGTSFYQGFAVLIGNLPIQKKKCYSISVIAISIWSSFLPECGLIPRTKSFILRDRAVTSHATNGFLSVAHWKPTLFWSGNSVQHCAQQNCSAYPFLVILYNKIGLLPHGQTGQGRSQFLFSFTSSSSQEKQKWSRSQ